MQKRFDSAKDLERGSTALTKPNFLLNVRRGLDLRIISNVTCLVPEFCHKLFCPIFMPYGFTAAVLSWFYVIMITFVFV